ncbi:hypothetical protein ACFP7A_04985 [Sporolactobacillus kofuensis]|uniref:Uncharacterized protein n=1 Tax=Sporolactobacillus kofuensis TaxID=269672 RepID=A0ABW1WBI9_9BACL|nr:hypothetical protein [Sporolactobacillus kofuensis]MCO7174800.1 hypothetical protein [Sporolactobacillus kofuensis]
MASDNLPTKIQQLQEEFERQASNELTLIPNVTQAQVTSFLSDGLLNIDTVDVVNRASKIINQDPSKTDKEVAIEILKQFSKSHKSRIIRKMARKLIKEKRDE